MCIYVRACVCARAHVCVHVYMHMCVSFQFIFSIKALNNKQPFVFSHCVLLFLHNFNFDCRHYAFTGAGI